VGYTVHPDHNRGLILVLQYRITGTGDQIDLPIRLEITRPNLGGVRWWGRCPLVVSNVACNMRVCKLYLPPGGRYFGCRHCHQLTYTNCQESHGDDRHNRRLAGKMGQDFATVKRLMSSLGKS
jgi:hypothetical protein